MKRRKRITKLLLVTLGSYFIISVVIWGLHEYKLVKCSMCLKSLASNIRVYRYDTGGKPLSWDAIISEYDFPQDAKLCPQTHKHYVYRGDDVYAKMPDELILLYDHKHSIDLYERISIFVYIYSGTDRIGVVFNNWDIEFVDEKKFYTIIERDNQLRKELGLEIKQAGAR